MRRGTFCVPKGVIKHETGILAHVDVGKTTVAERMARSPPPAA